MDIIGRGGETIHSMEAWAGLYSAHHWKAFRSAHAVAEFILHRNGARALNARVSEALGESVAFERAIPEMEVQFDQFGRGRSHDLGIFGRTASGKSLFVGVEAKVDEPFGALVREVYLRAKARQLAGESTNAPERIERLLKLHFRQPDTSVFDVRYQLLYATAGTLAASADVSIFYVAVFKTPAYSQTIAAANERDYAHFMARAEAMPLTLPTGGATGHTLVLGGKALLCLYESFERYSEPDIAAE